MTALQKPVKAVAIHFLRKRLHVTIGEAADWEEANSALHDYAERNYREDFTGRWNNFTQLRVLCMDKLLCENDHDPKTWNLREDNTEEHDDSYIIKL